MEAIYFTYLPVYAFNSLCSRLCHACVVKLFCLNMSKKIV